MPDALEVRIAALEQECYELRALVDGHESWSHRSRLHELEGDHAGAKLVAQALNAYTAAHRSKIVRLREWGSFVIAVAAVVVAVVAVTHASHPVIVRPTVTVPTTTRPR